MPVVEASTAPEPLCEWLERGLRQIPGQDPLGLQTITTDRILPALLPGILALSTRARYFSFYAFLLSHYAETGGKADNKALSDFIRRREFELCVAANLCTHCDGADAIGNRVVRPLVRERPALYERSFSIKTELGGYGLYYRSPMEEIGLVLRAGDALVEDRPTPIDLLAPGAAAHAIADAYREAVANTRWYRDWMQAVDPMPAEVLEELAEVGCLCRLHTHTAERDLLRQALLTAPTPEREEPAEQRRRAVALFLELLDDDGNVAGDTGAFRSGVIEGFLSNPSDTDTRGRTYAQWAAASMRECMQDTISSLWHHFCRAGLARQPFDGLTADGLRTLIREDLFESGVVDFDGTVVKTRPNEDATDWTTNLASVAEDWTWEEIADWTAECDAALSGLSALALLCERIPTGSGAPGAWAGVASVDGDHQFGLLRTSNLVRRRLESRPTVLEFLDWALRTFVIAPHETVANSKLPESTYRFWWEHNRLRFIDNGIWRFDPSGLRRRALASLSEDLGWWERDVNDEPSLLPDGGGVIREVFDS